MKKIIWIMLMTLAISLLFGQASDLFISEYIEGSSFNKAIEVYNGTGDAVDLSQYTLQKDVNGNGQFDNSYDFSGTLENDDVFVLANSQADDAILSVADDTNNGVINFNGNDQVRLLKNDVEIDHVGFPGGDDFAANVTLVRLPDVISPTLNYDEAEWDSYPQDYFDNLGFHVFSGTSDPTIIVTSPNGGEEWEQGSTHTITWTSINFDGNVKIELEMVYREVLVASTENDGEWEWEIPEDQTIDDYYSIIISDVEDGEPWDDSDNAFSIIEPIPVNPYTIYEIQYSTTGPSPHVGELVQTSGVVTAVFSDFFFIQDGTGAWNGINVYPIQDVEVGQEIQIVAYVAEYNDKTELTDIVNLEILGIADIPEAVTVTTNEAATMEEYEGVLIKLQDVTVTDPDPGYGEWLVDDGSGETYIDDLGNYSYLPALDDFHYSITGVNDYSYGAFKLEPRTDDDLNISGLEVLPQRLLFLNYDHCSNGKMFSITNFSDQEIVISDISQSNIFSSGNGEWMIEDFNISLPYTLEANEILDFNVVVNLFTQNRETIVTDTLYIMTDVGEKKIAIFFNADLNADTDDQTIAANPYQLMNHPNPFNPLTTISFSLTTESIENTEIIIYNAKGQKVKTFECIDCVDAASSQMTHSIAWNGRDDNNKPVSSGVYFYQLEINGKAVESQRCLLLK